MAYSELSGSTFGTYEEKDYYYNEDDFDVCATNTIGNRLLPMESLENVLQNSFCCCKCTTSNHCKYVNNFLRFIKEHNEKVEKEEDEILFGSRL